MGSNCHGICGRYSVMIPHGESPYDNDRKYCSTCQSYMEFNKLRCPCCKAMFRTKPRGTKSVVAIYNKSH